jgi:hypothetical protein
MVGFIFNFPKNCCSFCLGKLTIRWKMSLPRETQPVYGLHQTNFTNTRAVFKVRGLTLLLWVGTL